MLKQLACEQEKNMSSFDKGLVMESKDVETLWNNVGHDFWVVTPCHSRMGDAKFDGIRFICQDRAPNGHLVAVQIPVKPERQLCYNVELNQIFTDLEELKRDGNDLEQCAELCLTFYFFWVKYGVINKGIAACGLIALNALLIASGYTISEPLGSMQLDWEAYLTGTHTEFIKNVRGRMKIIPLSQDGEPCIGKPTWFSDVPEVAEHIPNLRAMIHVLNPKDEYV